MKTEMTFGLAVTLGSLAIAPTSHAQEAPLSDLPEATPPETAAKSQLAATVAIAPPPVAVSEAIDRTPEFTASKPIAAVVEPVAEPVVEPVVEPVSKPIAKPIAEPIVSSVVQQPAAPIVKAAIKPLVNPVVEPIVAAIAEPVAIEPSATPAVKPSFKSFNNPITAPPDALPEIPAAKAGIQLAQQVASPETDVEQLKAKQDRLERELAELRQKINQPTAQKTEVKPHEDLPSGLQIYSEALFLTPRSDLLMDYARVDPGAIFLATGGPIAALDYRESTGWRVNAKYRFPKSPWEVGASIFRVGSDAAGVADRPAGGFLFSTLTAPRGGTASATQAIATAKIDMTVTDLEAAYHIQPSSSVDFKLLGGLRMANVGQNMDAIYSGRSFAPIPGTFSASQQFRGLGPKAGAEARVALGGGFSIYGRGTGSLLFGDQESDIVETFQGIPVNNFKVNRKQTVPVIDAAIGVDWSTKLGDSGKLTIGAGYEYQHWFNLSRNIRYTDASAPGGFVENRGDLSMQGLFAKVGLSWTF